ncbi:PAS domain S-box protein [Rhodomicrobium vannielii]|uniref:PAS domain S-box protein n=1 Tax=Rhodomicrobium vannielii TaxID=1069 RepID=UPI000B4BFFF6|nr:PAS domain S-box protein [Rhodomicrobium vannielii]
MNIGYLSRRTVQIAFGLAIAVLLAVGAFSYRSIVASSQSNQWVRHSHEVLRSLQDLSSSMEGMSSGVRRFILTGEETDLSQYNAAKQRMAELGPVVAKELSDNPVQANRLAILAKLAAERTERADSLIALRRERGLEPAVEAAKGDPSPQEAADFNSLIGQMKDEELRLLEERRAAAADYLWQTKLIVILGTALGVLVTGVAGWSVLRDSLRRSRAEKALRGSEEEYRMLLDGVQDNAIFMIDPDGKVASWNAGAERVKGYRADQIIGRDFSCFFTPEDIERGRPARILRLTAANGHHEEQGMRVKKDGSRYLASVTFTALRDSACKLRGFSEFSHDLNESRDAGAKYRGLLEAAPDAMVVVDQLGEIVLLNLQAEKQFGYHRDELVGQKVTNIIPEGFAERLVADDLRSAEDAKDQQIGTGIELTGLRKDGSEFPIEIMLSPLASAEGTLVTAAIRDISVRQQAERHLAQMEGRYRGLLEAAPDAMVVVNQASEIVLLNLQAEKQFGYRRDELLGQKVTNIIPEGFAERLVADDLRSDEDAKDQQIGTGIELTALRKDGSEFPIELMLSPLESAEGVLVTAAIRDISVRKNAEKQLAQIEGKYRGLLEAAPDAMVVVNQAGEIVLLNLQAEKQFGYRRDELLGQRVTNIIPVGFAERLVADDLRSDEDALAQQIGTGLELTALRKDGSEFPIELMLSPLESADGTLVTAAIRNISVRQEAERHVVQMEGRYRGLLEAAPDAMVVVNQAGEIVLLNLQAEKQFGYRRDELLGQPMTNIIPEGFAERLIADDLRSAQEASNQRIGTGIELTALRKDGSEFPIELMLSPLESAEGTLVTTAIRDISVRKNAEKQLAQIEGKYRGLLEAAPDAMVVVNQAGEIVLLNLQAEKQFGYRRDELLGQKVTNIIPEGFAERLIADDLRSAEEAFDQQIGTGIELTALRKDGSQFPIELMLSPLDSTEGTLVTAAIRDITVRKDAEKYMAQMEGRYRGLLEAAPDAMVVVNQQGEIVLLNLQAEKQFGYRRNELLGQRVKNIIPHGFAERLIADGLRSEFDAVTQQIGTGIELTALRKDGSEFPIELMLSPLGGAEGVLVTAAIRNISVRKKAEASLVQSIGELRRSNDELAQFAYIASHDLQEPLRMVASYTQLLSRRYKGKLDSDADEFIAFAVDGANRMQRLIQDLLAYSRVGSKGKEMRATSSEVALHQALMNLRSAIRESGAKVTHGELPVVLADPMQLTQLFQNLVGNAIKYQKPGVPEIHISAAQDAALKWGFAVKDNGLGIDPQYFDRIFGMFQRLHKREEFAGTGIGLAICKKIVERHGGTISVESQPGEGSTFHFALTGSERQS